MKFRLWAVIMATLLIGLAIINYYEKYQWFTLATLLSIAAGILLHRHIHLLQVRANNPEEDDATLASSTTLVERFRENMKFIMPILLSAAISIATSVVSGYVWHAGWWTLLSTLGNLGAFIFGIYGSRKCDEEADRMVHALP